MFLAALNGVLVSTAKADTFTHDMLRDLRVQSCGPGPTTVFGPQDSGPDVVSQVPFLEPRAGASNAPLRALVNVSRIIACCRVIICSGEN